MTQSDSTVEGIARLRDRVFDTSDERRYISSLGTHIHPSRRQQHRVMTREALLVAYLKRALVRARWGTIDAAASIAHAKLLLRRARLRRVEGAA